MLRKNLEPANVGQRVVVRRRAGIGPAGRPVQTDLLGELLSISAEHLVIRDADGVAHQVPRSEITAAHPVPPRPPRHSTIVALERIADEAWPAPVRLQMGGWVLRSAQGWTNRVNSALVLGDPGLSLEEAITRCVQWYAEQGLPARITVPLPLHRAVADQLTRLGWQAGSDVLVQQASLAEVITLTDEGAHAPVWLGEQPTQGFLKMVRQRRHSLPGAALQVLSGPPQVRFAELRSDERDLLAIGRGALVGDGAWLHVGLVEVRPDSRRRGLARALVHALAQWAAACGANRALLQVDQHNEPALRLYARMGFHTHHRYRTFRQ